MARVIKFRAWDRERQRMLYEGFAVINQLGSSALFMNPNFGDRQLGSPWVILNGAECLSHALLQFTGLTDRTGQEIYEGDIIQQDEFVGVVIFDEGQFMVEWPVWIDGDKCWTLSQCVSVKVIGNLYEHPDLLPTGR